MEGPGDRMPGERIHINNQVLVRSTAVLAVPAESLVGDGPTFLAVASAVAGVLLNVSASNEGEGHIGRGRRLS